MTYLKLGILGVGLVFTVIASCFLYAQWGAVQEPLPVSLAALEQGESPPSRYIRIENYVARLDHAFVRQSVSESGHSAITVEFFYPIVSPENPAAAGEDVPLEQFAVVVRRTSVPTDPDGTPRVPSGPLQGAVAIGFDALEGDEVDFVHAEFPNVNANNVIVLIPGQKPWISLGSWIWLAFGVIVTLIGAASFLQPSGD